MIIATQFSVMLDGYLNFLVMYFIIIITKEKPKAEASIKRTV